MAKDNNEVKITFKAFNNEFNQGIKEMNAEASKLRQEMKLQAEQMKNSATDTEKLEASLSGLQKQYELAQQKTAATAQALEQARAQWGENSAEAQKYETKLRSMQIAEQQLANKITETGEALERAKGAYEDQTKSMQRLQGLFDVTGKSVDDLADTLGADLTRAIQNGTANANDLDKAFDKIAKSALGAGADINEIKQAISRLDGSNVDEIRKDLEKLGESADDASASIKELGESLVGAVAAGVGLSTAISESLDNASLNTKIDLTFAVSDESKESIKQVTRDVQAFGVDSEAALEGVRRQWALNKDASDEANTAILKGAAAISKAYDGIDFVELVQETNEIGKELKISDQAALDLVNNLLRVGFPPEQLDIIAEYGQQLRRAGFEAKEIQGIMAAAVNSGSWNIDNLLDGLKEGRIRAAEMGVGLTTGMEDAVREAVGTTEKMSDEQLSAMQSGFAKQEDALSRSLEKRANALSKSHRQQQKALDKQLSDEYNAVSKNYDNQQKALEKSLQASYDAVVKNYEKQQRELEKSQEKELREFEKLSEEKIKLIDKEYMEKMKLIDEDKYNQLKALDAQIDSLNAQTDAEDKAIKQREDAEKRAELNKKVRLAKTYAERQEAEKAVRDFEEKLQLEAVREQRKNQIDNLKAQKDGVKENSDAQKEALKSETDARKEQTKEQINSEKDALKERQNVIKDEFQQRKQEELKALSESNKAQIEAMRETNQSRLAFLREEQSARKEALSERLSDEMSAVRDSHKAELDSFKEMNKEKLELAKNPPDSAAVKAVFSQLEGFGKAIAAGGEEGSKAFEEMVMWLNEIEDATLQNAIGTELFGTMWEDQGEHIINSILNADEALTEMNKTQQTANELQDGMSGDPYVDIANALNQIRDALEPLMSALAFVISKIAEFASNNPILVSSIVALVGAVGTLTGAFFALQPVISMVQKLFGSDGNKGLSGIFKKFVPVLVNLSSKVLPALRLAFGFLTGPIGLIVTALTIAVPLIIKHWDSIVEFFKNLGRILLDLVKGAFKGIYDFIADILGKLVKFVDGIIKSIVGFFDFKGMVNSVKNVFGKAYDAIVSPIQKAKDKIGEIIDKIKGFFDFEFKWPELKVPKISIKKGSLNPLEWFSKGFPDIDIQWHKKGGVFNKPTLFNTGNGLHGVGEAGAEAVIPLNERVLGAIGDAIFRASNNGGTTQAPVVYNYERMLEGATFHVREEADIKKIARELYNQQQRDRKGR